MKTSALKPEVKCRVLFRRASCSSVPKESGCYVLATFDDEVLYVGLATSLFNRFEQHLDNQGKTTPTKWGRAFWFYFLQYSARNLNSLERGWLNQYQVEHGHLPTLNKVDSPVQ